VSLHAGALALLEGWIPEDDDQEVLRRRFVRHLRKHPDGMLRVCRPAHITASTLVVSRFADEVMLVLHGKAGRWFQFGGHCEETDASLLDAALRELREESGLSELVLDPDPVHLDAHPVPFCEPGGSVHLDVRFLAVVEPPDTQARSHVVADPLEPVPAEPDLVAWWPVDGLPSEEESLLGLVRAARRRMGCED
jgi:8-oxo-dGTP pyrophosphatase MutT (NUDIX family)